MDPVTHALSGALVARAFPPKLPDERMASAARWAVVLGSIFPDIDVLAKPFDPDGFATIRIHRSLTHSLVCLPVWAFVLAVAVGWFWRRRGIPAPGRGALTALFGCGIGLHILFDCITSFGTMVWSPISWTRVSWNWTFIVDLALTGVLLYFLLLARVAEEPAGRGRVWRAAWLLVLMAALAGVYSLGSYALGRPAPAEIPAAVLLAAAIPLGLTLAGRSFPLTGRGWARIGVLAAAVYLGMDAWAQMAALDRVAEQMPVGPGVLNAQAIPMPPNMTQWLGLIATDEGVREWTFSLADPPSARVSTIFVPARSGEACPAVLWNIPQVRAYLHFAEFPVVVCGHAPGVETAEFTDLRFARIPLRWTRGPVRQAPLPFTWRVTFDDAGRVLREGWVIE
ncbi:MAG TPA: metal-dependent hydrolase [Candidatus Acidoferrales bacterium]|nr:metal-dependent hydrolase [Candidatus Acidoferrales bacterium]